MTPPRVPVRSNSALCGRVAEAAIVERFRAPFLRASPVKSHGDVGGIQMTPESREVDLGPDRGDSFWVGSEGEGGTEPSDVTAQVR